MGAQCVSCQRLLQRIFAAEYGRTLWCCVRRYSYELKAIGEAIFTKPTVDIFGRRLAFVPATRLLALTSNALQLERVVAQAARLRVQLDQMAADEGAMSSNDGASGPTGNAAAGDGA